MAGADDFFQITIEGHVPTMKLFVKASDTINGLKREIHGIDGIPVEDRHNISIPPSITQYLPKSLSTPLPLNIYQ